MPRLTDPAASPGTSIPSARRRRIDADAVPVWRRALLSRRAAACYLGLSPAKLDRLSSAGLCPRPIKVGASVMYRRAELAAWTEAGCPPRAEWEARRRQH